MRTLLLGSVLAFGCTGAAWASVTYDFVGQMTRSTAASSFTYMSPGSVTNNMVLSASELSAYSANVVSVLIAPTCPGSPAGDIG